MNILFVFGKDAMETENIIGRKIKYIRQLNGLSQKELSIGICSQAEISKIENGKNTPTVDLLQQITNKLKIPVSELFKEEIDKMEKTIRMFDQTMMMLLRENKFTECLNEIDRFMLGNTTPVGKRMIAYYKIVLTYRQKQADYRTTSVLFTRLLDHENLIIHDPMLYIRIKMALSILYAEHEQYQQAEKIYNEVLRMDTEIKGVDEERLKVLYNYAKLLYKMNQPQKGLIIIEEAMQISQRLKKTSYLAHLYYQRGEFYERMDSNSKQVNVDYTMAYELFSAFQMKQYAQIVLETKKTYLLSDLQLRQK